MSKNKIVEITRKKYTVKNLDCANCALKIEENLRNQDGVKSVNLNFAAGTLQIESENTDNILKIVKSIEPEAELVEITSKVENESEELKHNPIIEIIPTIVSIGLLLVGIIFGSELRTLLFGLGEITIFLTAYLISGWKVIYSAVRNILKGKVFDENFLMGVATAGAFIIREYPEAVAVMIFYNIGEFFEHMALNKSRKSIKALVEMKPERANLLLNGRVESVLPETLQIGDKVLVKPGEKIPADGKIIKGDSQIDTASLTGESVPVVVEPGKKVMAGTINILKSLTIEVTRKFEESSAAKIIELLENASSKKASTERFVTTFAKYYTPLVVLGAAVVAFLPPLLGIGALSEWVHRALVLLVISCPCALVISIPLGYFGGIGRASKEGILIKGSNYIDVLAKTKAIAFDKTGTLTAGVFKVTRVEPRNGFTHEELLRTTALAESHSNHPVGKSIIEAYDGDVSTTGDINYQVISGYGVNAEFEGRNVLVGNDKILHKYGIEHDKCLTNGTIAHVAVDGVYAGYITVSDELKPDSERAVNELKTLGVNRLVMLTGDTEETASNFAGSLGLKEYYAGLLPEDKVNKLEEISRESKEKERVAFVGDGLNDSPVIARADVGIAMGGIGSEATIESADVIIMNDEPSKIAEAVRISRFTRKIVWQNIAFALGVKGIFIALGIFGITTMWEAVFSDVGVALIAVLNSVRILKSK